MSGLKKTKMGIVLSNKMDKTIVVSVARQVRHPLYKKYFTKRSKFKAHDEANQCQIGDKVEIKETKPISRDKNWVVTRILEKAVL